MVFINHACKFGIPSCFCAQNLGFSMNIFSFENLVLNLLNLDLAQTRYYQKVYMTHFSFIPSLRLDSTCFGSIFHVLYFREFSLYLFGVPCSKTFKLKIVQGNFRLHLVCINQTSANHGLTMINHWSNFVTL